VVARRLLSCYILGRRLCGGGRVLRLQDRIPGSICSAVRWRLFGKGRGGFRSTHLEVSDGGVMFLRIGSEEDNEGTRVTQVYFDMT
jgi:hypothetical protein